MEPYLKVCKLEWDRAEFLGLNGVGVGVWEQRD